jgi:hypothetical protein
MEGGGVRHGQRHVKKGGGARPARGSSRHLPASGRRGPACGMAAWSAQDRGVK